MRKQLFQLVMIGCLLGSAFPALGQQQKELPEAGAKKAAGMKNVGAEEFDKLRKEKGVVVLDVRTAKEYQAGHLPDAVNIDFNGPDFDSKVAGLDKNKTYLVHCAGGVRSAKACKKMEGLSFPALYNLEGGMKAWEKAGKSLEK